MIPCLPLLALLVATAAPASPTDVFSSLERLRHDRDAGTIDLDTYFRQTFRVAFAAEETAPAYRPASPEGPTCLTPWIAEYERARARLSAATTTEIDARIRPPRARGTATYLSPSGMFLVSYFLTGFQSIDPTDTDPANGIPDMAEFVAAYADSSWKHEFETLGFLTPPLPADGTYDIDIDYLGGGTLLGYCYSTGNAPGETGIRIRNRLGAAILIDTEDPEGPKRGRAKGTLSHEIKHASQYVGSRWSEGDWTEADANWVMDRVYDEHNMYKPFLFGPGQIAYPELSLDVDPTYHDFLWSQYLDERLGLATLLDFWDRRAADSTESVVDAYRAVQLTAGADWDTSYPEYMEWCWFVGTYADASIGFDEAAGFPLDMALREPALVAYPHAAADSVAHLAAHVRRCDPGTGAARITFDGDDAATGLVVSVIEEREDGAFQIVRPALDAGNAFTYDVSAVWPQLAYVTVIVTNATASGADAPYTLDVSDEPASASPQVAAAPSLSVAPNPFTDFTTIRFANARGTPAAVTIHDLAGRRVRRLSGDATVVWRGRDDAGRAVPAGVYWARVETPGGVVTRRITRLR